MMFDLSFPSPQNVLALNEHYLEVSDFLQVLAQLREHLGLQYRTLLPNYLVPNERPHTTGPLQLLYVGLGLPSPTTATQFAL